MSWSDKAYVRRNFITAEELASRTSLSVGQLRILVESELFPKPTYVFEDGTEWYPPTYSALMLQAKDAGASFAEMFRNQLRRALENLKRRDKDSFSIVVNLEGISNEGIEDLVQKIWVDFRSGEYGICLKEPMCGTIIKKDLLMHAVKKLISSPKPADPEWRIALRKNVDMLDILELPQTDFDRIRFGRPSSRDLLITEVHTSYPQVFAN